MCIVALAWQVCHQVPLFLISNRDEFYDRPSARLDYQEDLRFYAGRDLSEGGTWLGVTKSGRWAVLTNYRDGRDRRKFATSRGHLLTAFLQSDDSPMQFAKALQKTQQDYAGFNLIVGDRQQAVYMSNKGHAPEALHGGVYVLSNGLMGDDWEKVAHLRKRFIQELLPLIGHDGTRLGGDVLAVGLDVLEDARTQERLPDTGIDEAWERALSAIFVKTDGYGTCVSNVLTMTDETLTWHEKSQAGDDVGNIKTMHFALNG